MSDNDKRAQATCLINKANLLPSRVRSTGEGSNQAFTFGANIATSKDRAFRMATVEGRYAAPWTF